MTDIPLCGCDTPLYGCDIPLYGCDIPLYGCDRLNERDNKEILLCTI